MNFTFGSTTYSNPTAANHGQCGNGGDVRLDGGCGGGDARFTDGGGDNNNRLHGDFVSIIGSAACTFVFRASWNPSSFQLNGVYRAKVGCGGENGTFMLTQQCYYMESRFGRRETGSGPGVCT